MLKATNTNGVKFHKVCSMDHLQVLLLGGVEVSDSELSLLASHAHLLGELSLTKCEQYVSLRSSLLYFIRGGGGG